MSLVNSNYLLTHCARCIYFVYQHFPPRKESFQHYGSIVYTWRNFAYYSGRVTKSILIQTVLLSNVRQYSERVTNVIFYLPNFRKTFVLNPIVTKVIWNYSSNLGICSESEFPARYEGDSKSYMDDLSLFQTRHETSLWECDSCFLVRLLVFKSWLALATSWLVVDYVYERDGVKWQVK